MPAREPTEIDRIVGERIAALRKAKGLAQAQLGTALGVTYQQVQKYENGKNRVGASRLQDVAYFLGVPLSHFFDEDPIAVESNDALAFLNAPDALELLQIFSDIEDDQIRRDVLSIVRSAARIYTTIADSA